MSKTFYIPYQIVSNPDDTDFYKLTMKAAVHKFYPDVEVEVAFTCRTPGIDFRPVFDAICSQVSSLRNLSYSEACLRYLSNLSSPSFSRSYLRALSLQRWDPSVDILLALNADGSLDIRARGPWFNVIDYEIWVLTIVSEVWHKYQKSLLSNSDLSFYYNYIDNSRKIAVDTLSSCPDLKFTDFCTRRRASSNHHFETLDWWKNYGKGHLFGTSNVYLSRSLDLPVVGTHAHEWDQAHLAFTHPLNAKRLAMQRWLDAFNGELAITLTDTFTTDHFLSVFDRHFANAYDGIRHDSNDPIVWAKNMFDHYCSLNVDPLTKKFLFSDGLDWCSMVSIHNGVHGMCNPGYGIGTNFGCDTIIDPLQIVMKMTKCNDRPVMKISDVPGKVMCEDEVYKRYMLDTFK
jgi:nicotinate phosphoribosyltransferase